MIIGPQSCGRRFTVRAEVYGAVSLEVPRRNQRSARLVEPLAFHHRHNCTVDLRHFPRMLCDTCTYSVSAFVKELEAVHYLRKFTTTRRLERIVPCFFISSDVCACDCWNAIFVSVVLINLAILRNSIRGGHIVLISRKVFEKYAYIWVFGRWLGSRVNSVLPALHLCLLEFVVWVSVPVPLFIEPMVQEEPRVAISYEMCQVRRIQNQSSNA